MLSVFKFLVSNWLLCKLCTFLYWYSVVEERDAVIFFKLDSSQLKRIRVVTDVDNAFLKVAFFTLST